MSFTHKIVVALSAMLAIGSSAAVDLADAPLFTTVSVPGNLALALSVEWPTATTPAYVSTTAYSASTTYVGYFDPLKCYTYNYNSTTPANSYFKPYGLATNHLCTSSATALLWSGNLYELGHHANTGCFPVGTNWWIPHCGHHDGYGYYKNVCR